MSQFSPRRNRDLVRYAEDGGSYKRVKVVPGPTPAGATEARLLSSSADALNIAYPARAPSWRNASFPDGRRLHQPARSRSSVLKWLDGSTFLTMRPHRGEDFDRCSARGMKSGS